MTCSPRHVEVPAPRRDLEPAEARAAAERFADVMATRRTIRHFSSEPVDLEVIAAALRAAATAPSGANLQPWRFVVVTDAATKAAIRRAAEEEERTFYGRRASAEWLERLAPLGTDWRKPHLTDAPVLIVVFEIHDPKPYYVKESVGIAVGLLLAALHHAGYATLTHTPSPMRFLTEVLDRPASERAHLVIPVGHAAPTATVPDIRRKPLDEIITWF